MGLYFHLLLIQQYTWESFTAAGRQGQRLPQASPSPAHLSRSSSEGGGHSVLGEGRQFREAVGETSQEVAQGEALFKNLGVFF